MLRFMRAAIGAVAMLVISAAAADAHPLGNFTVNHLVLVRASDDRLAVRYVLDEAEIPAFATLRDLERRNIGLPAWARETASQLAPALDVRVDGTRRTLNLLDARAETRPGAGGLRTLRLVAAFEAVRPANARTLDVRDGTFAGRLGWHDVVVNDEREPTAELTAYPAAVLGSPRDLTDIHATFGARNVLTAGVRGQAAAGQPSIARNDALSAVLMRDLSSPLLLAGAFLLAIGLGALHAFEPGHGKTLLAVSLVGARATTGQAVILAASLTAAHTVGVFALGLVVLLAARWIVPETIYPWIALGSGALVALLGARALGREIARRRPHGHDALDDEAHARAHAIPGQGPLSFREALTAAVTGNIAPCPAALVVLLGAVALHRVAFGMALVVAFSIGLALVLTGLGIAVVRGAAWLARNPRFDQLARWGPLVTAGVIATLGTAMLADAFGRAGIAPAFVVAPLIALAIGGYALSAKAGHTHGHPHADDHHHPDAAADHDEGHTHPHTHGSHHHHHPHVHPHAEPAKVHA